MADQVNAFVIVNPEKCIGCKACELACAVVHAGSGTKVAGTMAVPVIPHLFIATAGAASVTKAGLTARDVMVAGNCKLCIACSSDRPACVAACPKEAIAVVFPAAVKIY